MDELKYDYSETAEAEQYNTLVLLDLAIGKAKLQSVPQFHILGGTGLVFHNILHISTVDIDTANTLSKEVKAIVEPFISDNASEVALLPKNYQDRLVPYKPDCFSNINVFVLSLEDIIITKLGSWRHKDVEDLSKTNVMDIVDYSKLFSIINSELEPAVASDLLIKLTKI